MNQLEISKDEIRMIEKNNDKRKHYRFPAFDDEMGVKLSSGSHRVLFKDEVFLDDNTWGNSQGDSYNEFSENTRSYETNNRDNQDRSAVMQKDEDLFHSLDHLNFQQPIRQEPQMVQKPAEKLKRRPTGVYPQKDRANHSSYHRTTTVPQKKDRDFTVRDRVNDFQVKRSHFVPKHIPASLVGKKEGQEEKVDRQQLLAAMRHEQDDYLMFDFDDQTNFQVKQHEEDPSVQEFRHSTVHEGETASIVSRRALKDNNKNIHDEDFTMSRVMNTINRSAKHKNDETPYEKKQEEMKRKNSRLEKSLSGIMSEENPHLEKTSYFDV